jgi:hypothetical protein
MRPRATITGSIIAWSTAAGRAVTPAGGAAVMVIGSPSRVITMGHPRRRQARRRFMPAILRITPA